MEYLIFSIIASLVAGIIVSGFLYFKKSKGLSKPVFWAMATLRAFGFALLLWIIIAPFIPIKSAETIRPKVVVLADNSQSLAATPKSAEQAQGTFSQLKNQLDDIKNADVKWLNFDDQVSSGEITFEGSATDIHQALKSVQNQSEEIGAVVLVSDGIVNRGFNPLYQSENMFAPIFAVGLGDSAKQKDVAIKQIRAAEYVFRGDELIVETVVAGENAFNFSGNVQWKENGKVIREKQIESTNADFAQTIQFTFSPKTAGVHVYELTVDALPEEQNKVNNTRQFSVEVIENRKRISVFSTAPHPDVAALKEALKKVEAYEVVHQKLGATIEDKTALAVVFVQPKTTAAQLHQTLQNFSGALWLFVHPNVSGSVFQDELAWLSKVGAAKSLNVRAKMKDKFGLFRMTKPSLDAFNNMPALNVFPGEIRTQGVLSSLLVDVQNQPIASYGNIASQRVALFAFDGLWLWRMADYKENETHAHVDEWLQLSAQYLTSQGKSNRLVLDYEKRNAAGAEIVIWADVFDASFEPSQLADVTMILENESGETFDFQFIPQDGRYIAQLEVLPEGSYSFSAVAILGEETLRNSGSFIVESQSLEMLNTRANFSLLSQLANSTGGQFFTDYNLQDLKAALENHPNLTPLERIHTRSLSLFDLQWLFYMALLLLGTEWLLRRYFGTI